MRWRHVVKRGLNASTKTLMIETDEAAKSPPTTVRSVLEPRFRGVKRGLVSGTGWLP